MLSHCSLNLHFFHYKTCLNDIYVSSPELIHGLWFFHHFPIYLLGLYILIKGAQCYVYSKNIFVWSIFTFTTPNVDKHFCFLTKY